MRGEKYYFHMKGSMQDETKPTWSEIEMNIQMNIPAWEVLHLSQVGYEGLGNRGVGLDRGWQGARLGAEDGEWGPDCAAWGAGARLGDSRQGE